VLFSIVHDISDRVRAERQLVESEANYRRALEQASDAILVTDRQGLVIEANARAEELLGRGRGEPTVALGLTKQALAFGQQAGLSQSLDRELSNLELSCRTTDFKEGLAAFRERRDPDFTGR